MKICANCNGTGIDFDDEICDMCNGEGIESGMTFTVGKINRRKNNFNDEAQDKTIKFDKKNASRQ